MVFSQSAFYSFEKGFSTEPGSEVALKNLPSDISQDSIGLCYSHAAAQIFNYHNCRLRKIDCSQLPDSERASALAMARYTARDVPDDEVIFASSYKGIYEGGYAGRTLAVASLVVGSVPSEQCASLDRALGKLNNSEDIKKAQSNALKKLKDIYKNSKAIDKKCTTCLATHADSAQKEIEQNFNVKTSNEKLLKAFAEDSYEKFFDELMIPTECLRTKNSVFFEGHEKMDYQYYPKGKKSNYEESKNKIIEVLSQGNPLLLESVCLDETATSKCQDSHTVVVTGFRRVCNQSKKRCFDAIRIQNSWGKSWQDEYDGGWVEAKNLLNATKYEEGHLSWLEMKADK